MPWLMMIAVVLISVSACSQRAVYDNVQLNQRQECERGPQAVYEECMERISRSYEEYMRERQEYLEARKKERQNQPD